jgi:hypothetical protein
MLGAVLGGTGALMGLSYDDPASTMGKANRVLVFMTFGMFILNLLQFFLTGSEPWLALTERGILLKTAEGKRIELLPADIQSFDVFGVKVPGSQLQFTLRDGSKIRSAHLLSEMGFKQFLPLLAKRLPPLHWSEKVRNYLQAHGE